MSITRIILLYIFCGINFHANAQGYLRTDGKKIINDKGEVILRGVGLGGWMLQEPYMLNVSDVAGSQQEIRQKITTLIGENNTEKFYEAWLNNHCTKRDIDSLAAWGFNSVRLPMHYNLYTLPVENEKTAGKNTWLTKGFTMTDSLLSWCKANRIYLILDMHAAPGGQGNDNAISDRDASKKSLWQSEANQQKLIALWSKLAERYANEQWIGAYDIINEPNWGFENESDRNGCAEKLNIPLRKLMVDISKAIRKKDKKHIIIIEGNCWGNNYQGVFPLWDKNTVLSFHKYWNYNTTESIQQVLQNRSTYNVPVWLGETGENSNTWFTSVIRLMEENKIGWNMWPLKKSGKNNLLQVPVNQGFKDIIAYWNGQTQKPSEESAFKSLMEFARNTNIANNIVRREVIDAMTRQVTNDECLSFQPNKINVTPTLFASDYDLGRSGMAYHDADSAEYWVSAGTRTKWNEGGHYRNDGVDIETCTDSLSNGFQVGWIVDGEWLQYTLYTDKASTYDLHIRSASQSATGELQLFVNGSATETKLTLPATGSFNTWQTSTMKSVKLNAGMNRVRVMAVKGGFNLNYFQFIPTDNTAMINLKESIN
ncbi:MAG TPA: cellulase family glycosylhydrolase [Ferruginibacter sp.]|nr:cellulase family glycosylhydrolase [Ferruginibacter sp.]